MGTKFAPTSAPAVMNISIALATTNHETLDGVQEYFTRVGARLTNISKLDDALHTTAGVDVVVLFADDYPREMVLRAVEELSVKLIIVVTGEVRAYVPRAAKGSAARVLVLARPAWGWMLLDAVRLAVPPGGKD
jgi:hypothetical protein